MDPEMHFPDPPSLLFFQLSVPSGTASAFRLLLSLHFKEQPCPVTDRYRDVKAQWFLPDLGLLMGHHFSLRAACGVSWSYLACTTAQLLPLPTPASFSFPQVSVSNMLLDQGVLFLRFCCRTRFLENTTTILLEGCEISGTKTLAALRTYKP